MIENIKKQMQEKLAELAGEKAAWEAVTYNTKKDGKPFSVMSKNFGNATYKKCQFSIQAGENEIEVSYKIPPAHYMGAQISCYRLVEDMGKEERERLKEKNPNQFLVKSCPYIKQVYTLNAEEIKSRIQERIQELKNHTEVLTEQLKNIEKIYDEYNKAYTAANEALINNLGLNKYTEVFHAIKKDVERY